MNGSRYATAFFITRALFTTCGRNILPGAKQIAHHAHAGHERAFDHVERARDFLARFLGVRVDVIDDAFDERVRETLLDRRAAPRFILRPTTFPFAFTVSAKSTSRSVASARRLKSTSSTQLAQLRLDLLVNRELPGIDDPHVEPGLDGVIEKRGVHRFAHGVVAAEGKRNVADAAADACAGQIRLDPARRLDEIDGVIVDAPPSRWRRSGCSDRK